MSHLSDHAHAFRVLGEVLMGQAAKDDVIADATGRMILMELGVALDLAANRLDAQARAATVDHSCTVDHRALKAVRCPACNAPRG